MDRMSPSDGDDMGSIPVSNTIFLLKDRNMYDKIILLADIV